MVRLPTRLRLALAIAALQSTASCLGCQGSSSHPATVHEAAAALRQRFPTYAAHVLGGAGFTRADHGLVPRQPMPRRDKTFPRTRPPLDLAATLPLSAQDPIRFELSDGFAFSVHEAGIRDQVEVSASAAGYVREGGVSLWTVQDRVGGRALEEWLLLESSAAAKAVRWEVSGATLRQRGEAVEIVDGVGRARIRVTAPVAYASGTPERRIDARLRVVSSNPRRIELDLDGAVGDGPVLVDPLWQATGNAGMPRTMHTATLLLDGTVLVVGGDGGTAGSALTAEIYEPSDGTFWPTDALVSARAAHTATLLRDGRVLVTGGFDGSGSAIATAELYDPNSQTWRGTGGLVNGRAQHTSTLLPSGKVLVAGGMTRSGGSGTDWLSSAELYDPAAGTWTFAGAMQNQRGGHTANLLQNGRVLVAGGWGPSSMVATMEIYDPASGPANPWSTGASLTTARALHSATLLANGRVLFVGGLVSGGLTPSAELYDPDGVVAPNPSTVTALTTGRSQHTATLLTDGRVLIAGGDTNGSAATASNEIFNPSPGPSGGWSTGPPVLATGRAGHTATLLPTSRVLVVGGKNAAGILVNAELFDPAQGEWRTVTTSPLSRTDHTATLLPNRSVLFAGGRDATRAPLSTSELFGPTGAVTSTSGTLVIPRFSHSATMLASGKILVVGGVTTNDKEVSAAEIFDPSTGRWTSANALTTARRRHSALLLANGKVMVSGGTNQGLGTSCLASVELYDPSAGSGGSWNPGTSLRSPRCDHSATLLFDNDVLIAGGEGDLSVTLASAEIYSFTGPTKATPGEMSFARSHHTATMLPNGEVLVTGGTKGTTVLSSAEIFDPYSGPTRWRSAPLMRSARDRHTATLLTDGRVLVVGGVISNPGVSSCLGTAEIYDPMVGGGGSWTSTVALGSSHCAHTATLLDMGSVLIAGGWDATEKLVASQEVFDDGRGRGAAWTPVVTSVTGDPRRQAVVVTGSWFTGVSEGSSGGRGSSATNYPLLRLMREGSGHIGYEPASSWSQSFASMMPHAEIQDGVYWASVVVSGVPSETRPLLVDSGSWSGGPKAQGATCTAPSECTSGFCVDQVCCNSFCGGPSTLDCMACSVNAGASSQGACTMLLGRSCDDGSSCTRNDQCTGGGCFGSPYSCTPNECQVTSTCDGRGCTGQPKVASTPCDDLNPCTKNDSCAGGICTGTPYTCIPKSCELTSVCDKTGGCTVTPRSTGALCDDGDLCTNSDVCSSSGVCRGTSYRCGPGPCHQTSVCNGEGGCAATNKADGAPCSDDDGCTTGDSCVAGVCEGALYTCTANQCQQESKCNGIGGCRVSNKAPGTTCDDKDLCTKDDTCLDGVCRGTAYKCEPTQCQVSATCDGKGNCATTPQPDGLKCDDGDPCTAPDSCVKGKCAGTTYSCAPTQCQASSQCDGAGACKTTPKQDGTACSDGFPCTFGDRCVSGLCTGGKYSCTAGECEQSSECDGTGGCIVSRKPDGATCDDGKFCTRDDKCKAGTCRGTDYECTPGRCQSNSMCDGQGGCRPVVERDGTACDDNEKCTTGDECQGGMCKGILHKCTATACQVESVCDGAGSCTIKPQPDGVKCDDGDPCTAPDSCVKGKCAGTTYSCAPTQCQASSQCDGKNGCTIKHKAPGLSCDDGNPCTKNDVCDGTDGCKGTSYTCTPKTCQLSDCDGVGRCQVKPKANGTVCDDGNPCTESDACAADGCKGSPITCASRDACHLAGQCDPATGQCSGPLAPDGTPCPEGLCASGACVARKAVGAACAAGPDCASGHCADGACCDHACGGPCDRCDLPESRGRCSLVAAGTAGAPSCSPFLCTGTSAECPKSCAIDGECEGEAHCRGGTCFVGRSDAGETKPRNYALAVGCTSSPGGHEPQGHWMAIACVIAALAPLRRRRAAWVPAP